MNRIKHSIIVLLLLVAPVIAWAQSNAVVVNNVTQTRQGKEYYVHIAQPGQTVFSIARAYGLHYSAAVLRTTVQNMAPGDTVWLPVNAQSRAAVEAAVKDNVQQPATIEVTVQPKQTLYGLAKQYNTTVERIEALNPEVKASGLKAGQTIRVPAMGNNAHIEEATPSPTNAPKRNTNVTVVSSLPPQTTSTTAATPQEPAVTLNPKERVSADKVHVTVMMPLYLDKMGEISTTKFDVEQRGKKSYKSFEFIQFYEGILMGLSSLEKKGINVVLNVVDITTDDEAAVAKAFQDNNVAQSDFVIALLTKKPFQKVAELARDNRVFVISPMSERDEILKNNPYVVKYTPSYHAIAQGVIEMVTNKYADHQLYVVHSKGRNEAALVAEFTSLLKDRTDIKYTFFEWSNNGKLVSTLKSTKKNVVVNLYDQDRDKNRIQTNLLLNRLIAVSPKPILMTPANYVRDLADADYAQLQSVNYHMLYTGYLDYDNVIHKNFIDDYKERFKTEPAGSYAAIANDIIIYFATAIHQRGSNFWKSPSIPKPSGMLFPLNLKQSSPSSGFENQTAVFYQMEDLKLKRAK